MRPRWKRRYPAPEPCQPNLRYRARSAQENEQRHRHPNSRCGESREGLEPNISQGLSLGSFERVNNLSFLPDNLSPREPESYSLFRKFLAPAFNSVQFWSIGDPPLANTAGSSALSTMAGYFAKSNACGSLNRLVLNWHNKCVLLATWAKHLGLKIHRPSKEGKRSAPVD